MPFVISKQETFLFNVNIQNTCQKYNMCLCLGKKDQYSFTDSTTKYNKLPVKISWLGKGGILVMM